MSHRPTKNPTPIRAPNLTNDQLGPRQTRDGQTSVASIPGGANVHHVSRTPPYPIAKVVSMHTNSWAYAMHTMKRVFSSKKHPVWLPAAIPSNEEGVNVYICLFVKDNPSWILVDSAFTRLVHPLTMKVITLAKRSGHRRTNRYPDAGGSRCCSWLLKTTSGPKEHTDHQNNTVPLWR